MCHLLNGTDSCVNSIKKEIFSIAISLSAFSPSFLPLYPPLFHNIYLHKPIEKTEFKKEISKLSFLPVQEVIAAANTAFYEGYFDLVQVVSRGIYSVHEKPFFVCRPLH